MNGLFGSNVFRVTETGLDAAAYKHQVISDNISNVDTPGFKRSEVVFEDILQQAAGDSGLDSGTTFTIGSDARPYVYQANDTSMRLDGNNVDMDAESAKLAENTLYYDGLTRLISSKFSGLRNAIKEGR